MEENIINMLPVKNNSVPYSKDVSKSSDNSESTLSDVASEVGIRPTGILEEISNEAIQTGKQIGLSENQSSTNQDPEKEEGEIIKAAPVEFEYKTVGIKFPIQPPQGPKDRMSKFSRYKLKKSKSEVMRKTMTDLEEQRVRLGRVLDSIDPSNQEKISIYSLKIEVLGELMERLEKFELVPTVPERKAVNMKGGLKFLNKYMAKKHRMIAGGDTRCLESITIKQPVPKNLNKLSVKETFATNLETEGLEEKDKKRFVSGIFDLIALPY